MKEQITVKAEARAKTGTSNMGRLRRTGWLPAVVYSEGKPAANLQVNEHDFELMLHHHRGEHVIVDLAVAGGEAKKVLLKEVQHHPVSGHVLHADFYEVSMTRKVRVEIPLRLVGDPTGVTQQGGILDHLLRTVLVECLPGDLMEQIDIDVSGLALGKHLAVRDIKLDLSKYTMLSGADVAIAAVSAPKAEEVVATPAEGEAAAAAEPEVITAKKPEEGEEGEAAPAGKAPAGKAPAGKEAKEAAPAGKEKAPAKEKGGKEKAEKK